MKMENGPKPLISTIHVDELNADQIMAIHISSGHPGVRCTTYFARRICPVTPRPAVKIAIRTCEECQSIDPAPVHWEKGTLEVDDKWQRVGMDITHPSFPNTHRLNLEAIDKARLCKHDLPAGDSVFFNVSHHMNSLLIMTQPSAAGSSGLLQMIGESTCGFVMRTSQLGME